MSSKDQSTETSLIPLESVEQRILSIRKQRVMQDVDLAELYGVATGAGRKLRPPCKAEVLDKYAIRIHRARCDHGASVNAENRNGRTSINMIFQCTDYSDYTEITRMLLCYFNE